MPYNPNSHYNLSEDDALFSFDLVWDQDAKRLRLFAVDHANDDDPVLEVTSYPCDDPNETLADDNTRTEIVAAVASVVYNWAF